MLKVIIAKRSNIYKTINEELYCVCLESIEMHKYFSTYYISLLLLETFLICM